MTSHDKHSNNSDTSQDLLALKRRGIDPFDGIDDDKGSRWHLFKDQLATAALFSLPQYSRSVVVESMTYSYICDWE